VDRSARVRDVSRLIQTSIPNHVRLRLELGEGLPCLQADGSQIQKLVMNLIINAAEPRRSAIARRARGRRRQRGRASCSASTPPLAKPL
jgi:nitrogen-specific signal transduction histidine kinase